MWSLAWPDTKKLNPFFIPPYLVNKIHGEAFHTPPWPASSATCECTGECTVRPGATHTVLQSIINMETGQRRNSTYPPFRTNPIKMPREIRLILGSFSPLDLNKLKSDLPYGQPNLRNWKSGKIRLISRPIHLLIGNRKNSTYFPANHYSKQTHWVIQLSPNKRNSQKYITENSDPFSGQ